MGSRTACWRETWLQNCALARKWASEPCFGLKMASNLEGSKKLKMWADFFASDFLISYSNVHFSANFGQSGFWGGPERLKMGSKRSFCCFGKGGDAPNHIFYKVFVVGKGGGGPNFVFYKVFGPSERADEVPNLVFYEGFGPSERAEGAQIVIPSGVPRAHPCLTLDDG